MIWFFISLGLQWAFAWAIWGNLQWCSINFNCTIKRWMGPKNHAAKYQVFHIQRKIIFNKDFPRMMIDTLDLWQYKFQRSSKTKCIIQPHWQYLDFKMLDFHKNMISLKIVPICFWQGNGGDVPLYCLPNLRGGLQHFDFKIIIGTITITGVRYKVRYNGKRFGQ